MKNGFRQSMAWLHTWAGVTLGWLLFAVFLTGTIAYFRQEVTLWMQPELHAAQPSAKAAENAIRTMSEMAPGAGRWTLTLPDDRSRTVSVSWRDAGAGKRDRKRAQLDPATGEHLDPRETRGGNFLYRFHFELYALPRDVARWIVGIATLSMFVAIISGVITHRNIFKDFFTFRPRKGQRSWLDLHNVTAVLGLPYHLMITYSGLLLLITTLMPFAMDQERRGGPRGGERPAAEKIVEMPPLAPIAPMLAQAEAAWGQGVGRIIVLRPGGEKPVIELAPLRNTHLTAHSGSGSAGVERMRFNGRTGDLISAKDAPELSTVRAAHNVFTSLHRARYADTATRWLYFLSGIAGTVMVGTGLLLWVAKRRAKHLRGSEPSLGFRLVARLNIGAVAGLPMAVGAYFWANRLLPVDLAGRGDWEIRCFFFVWAAAALYPFARRLSHAWPEVLFMSGGLLAGLPVVNALTTDSHLGHSLAGGDWMVAAVDLAALALGLAFLAAAGMLVRRRTTGAPARTVRRAATTPTPGAIADAPRPVAEDA